MKNATVLENALVILGGCIALVLILGLAVVVSGGWVYLASKFLHYAFPSLPAFSWLQSLAVGFCITFVLAPIFRNTTKASGERS